MHQKSIMIVGLGDLGGHAPEFLALGAEHSRRSSRRTSTRTGGFSKTNSAIAGASQFGLYPDISFIELDALDVDKTAALLREIRPTRIVYNSMTLQSWWVITQLPPGALQADRRGKVRALVSDAFPPDVQADPGGGELRDQDAGGQRGLPGPGQSGPGEAGARRLQVAIGNIDSLLTHSGLTAARMYNAPLRLGRVYLVAPHFFQLLRDPLRAQRGGALLLYEVMIDDRDIAPLIDGKEFLANVIPLAKGTRRVHAHPVVAYFGGEDRPGNPVRHEGAGPRTRAERASRGGIR